jgi:aminoglycoside 6-adenylyltransferase
VTQTSTSVLELLNRFVLWAEDQADIRAVLMIGSRARVDHPADQWSDIDLIISASNPQPYLEYTEWLKNIGPVWATHVEPTLAGVHERRVLFEDGYDFDLIFVADNMLSRLIQNDEVARIVRRGVRILVDKDRLMSRITLPLGRRPAYVPPTQAQFTNLINDFWYHAAWTAKKLRRGELWTALMSNNSYMKNLLMQMLEWHTHAISSENYDTWYQGRFVEEWADLATLEQLGEIFAHYDADDIKRTLAASMNLFRRVATETAAQLTYTYPYNSDANVSEWVKTILDDSM